MHRSAAIPATDPRDIARRRAILGRSTLVVIALAVFAAWSTGPYVTVELRRLEPWKIAAVCCGDAIAALWFIYFAVSFFIFGAALEDRPAQRSDRRIIAFFIISMIGGVVLDLCF